MKTLDKKLFLVIPTLRQGGAERVMSEIANRGAVGYNLEIHLVLLFKSDDFYKIDSRVKIHRLEFENKGGLYKGIALLNVFLSFRKLLKINKPDAVLSFMQVYNSFTILTSAFLGIDVFISDRNNPVKTLSIFSRILRFFTYRFAKGIISQTYLAKDVLESKITNNNIEVIPNPAREIQRYDIDKEKIILNVGRLVPEKGQVYLVDAFSKVRDSEWKLVILGEGPLRNVLEEQINKLDLSDRVFLLGAVKNVDEWLCKASIFAFSSISEGFPNALIEAMNAGLPCVSFDCNAGPRDIINNYRNGILIPERNVEMLTTSINDLIESEVLRKKLGDAAREVNRTFSMETVILRYFTFLNLIDK